MEYWIEKFSGSFTIANGPEKGKIYFSGSGNYIMYKKKKKEGFLRTIKMEPLLLPPSSVFIERLYVQYTGAEYSSLQNLRFYIYFVLDESELTDTLEFSCGGGLPMIQLL